MHVRKAIWIVTTTYEIYDTYSRETVACRVSYASCSQSWSRTQVQPRTSASCSSSNDEHDSIVAHARNMNSSSYHHNLYQRHADNVPSVEVFQNAAKLLYRSEKRGSSGDPLRTLGRCRYIFKRDRRSFALPASIVKDNIHISEIRGTDTGAL